MKWRTAIETNSLTNLVDLDYDNSSVFIGSCFSQHIGGRLQSAKFTTSINPLGIVYNPVSLLNLSTYLKGTKILEKTDLFESPKGINHFDFHGTLTYDNVETAYAQLTKHITDTAEQIKSAHCLFLTLGTAIVYVHHAKGIVNNCHKMAASSFSKRMLSFDEIKKALIEIIKNFKSINPTVSIVFTVSPIRHTRHGLVQDRLSKSLLIAAVHEVLQQEVSYFPSYEMLIDDLRDYRFFAPDLIHPNDQAIDYIWDHFVESCIDKNSKMLLQKVQAAVKELAHKPFNAHHEDFQKFNKKLLSKLSALNNLGINFSDEIRSVQARLSD